VPCRRPPLSAPRYRSSRDRLVIALLVRFDSHRRSPSDRPRLSQLSGASRIVAGAEAAASVIGSGDPSDCLSSDQSSD
jgi:hypothetical protein